MADLRTETDASYYFGELKMWNDGPRRGEVGVIVEGYSDEVLYSKMLCKSCCFFSTDGWENAEKIIEKVSQFSIEGIVGILDSDFRRITPKNFQLENTFYTDGHDLEIMMVNSAAWDNLLHQHCHKSRLEKFEKSCGKPVLEILLELASELAAVRLLNYSKSFGLRFKSGRDKSTNYLKFGDFIDEKNLIIDLNKLYISVENKSSKQGLISKDSDLQGELRKIKEAGYDLYEFCNGHDILNLFSLALKSAISNKTSSNTIHLKDLETQLSIAYRFADFQNTKLYQNLLAWELSHSPKYRLFC